jgi:hypothetical protein
MRNSCKILHRKPERKRPLANFKRRWEGDDGMDNRKIGWEELIFLKMRNSGGFCILCNQLSFSKKKTDKFLTS